MAGGLKASEVVLRLTAIESTLNEKLDSLTGSVTEILGAVREIEAIKTRLDTIQGMVGKSDKKPVTTRATTKSGTTKKAEKPEKPRQKNVFIQFCEKFGSDVVFRKDVMTRHGIVDVIPEVFAQRATDLEKYKAWARELWKRKDIKEGETAILKNAVKPEDTAKASDDATELVADETGDLDAANEEEETAE
jgi:phosphoribosylamine-glycine ligase